MKRDIFLTASLMCADFTDLKSEIEILNKSGISSYHCDVMDGEFVPNMSMGLKDIETVNSLTSIPIDVHLMLNNAASKLDWFISAGADTIYLHPEKENNIIKSLLYLKSKNVKAGLAINPEVTVESIKEILNVCDVVMVMTVNPGFAGQKFLSFTNDKIRQLIELKNKYDYTLILDGACSPEIIKEYYHLGCDGFVLGTSALFKDNKQYKNNIDKIKSLIY